MNANNKYDWSKIHIFFRYVVIDKHGQVFGYRDKPSLDTSRDRWESPYGGVCIGILTEKTELDWRDSLEARPKIFDNKNA